MGIYQDNQRVYGMRKIHHQLLRDGIQVPPHGHTVDVQVGY